MKRVDRASVFGVVLGLSAVVLGNALEGGAFASLIQPAAFLVVVGGTLGATLLGTPLATFIAAGKALREVFTEDDTDLAELVEQLCDHAQKARREGIVSLESAAEASTDPLLQRALRMAVDGTEGKVMRHDLELIVHRMDDEGHAIVRVWESAGGFAPTIGILGAVLGLIHVMQNLTEMARVGSGIAVAFVATIYGVGFANLLLLPMAEKLRVKHERNLARMEVIVEGTLAIQGGKKPNLVREMLEGLVQRPPAEPTVAAPVVRRFPLLK